MGLAALGLSTLGLAAFGLHAFRLRTLRLAAFGLAALRLHRFGLHALGVAAIRVRAASTSRGYGNADRDRSGRDSAREKRATIDPDGCDVLVRERLATALDWVQVFRFQHLNLLGISDGSRDYSIRRKRAVLERGANLDTIARKGRTIGLLARKTHPLTDQPNPELEVDRDWYAWLIDPLSTAEFESEYYEQQPFHIRRETSLNYSELLSVADLDAVLGSHSASYPDISLVRGDGDVASSKYTYGDGRIQPLEVVRHFDSGATVIFRQLQRRVPTLARLCAELGRSFSSRVQANVYLTPPEAQGFAPHWDTHDVFVLQVSGAKRWSIYDTKVRLPLRGQRFKRGTPPGDVSDEFELGPGSAVYIPRGLMHSARSTDRASLHITLGITAYTWAEFLLESVNAAALQEESLRRNLPLDFTREGFPVAERARLFREQLAVVQSRFDPEVVWRRFKDEILAIDVPIFADLFTERLRGDRLTLRSRVKHRAGLLTESVTEGETCLLRFSGREVRLPVRVWPALRFATTADEFAVRDLPDCLDAKGKLTLVTRLVREGVLQRK